MIKELVEVAIKQGIHLHNTDNIIVSGIVIGIALSAAVIIKLNRRSHE